MGSEVLVLFFFYLHVVVVAQGMKTYLSKPPNSSFVFDSFTAANTCPVLSPSSCTATATCARAWRSLNINLSSGWARSISAWPSRAPAPCKVRTRELGHNVYISSLRQWSSKWLLSTLQSFWAHMAWMGPSPVRHLRCLTTLLRSSSKSGGSFTPSAPIRRRSRKRRWRIRTGRTTPWQQWRSLSVRHHNGCCDKLYFRLSDMWHNSWLWVAQTEWGS